MSDVQASAAPARLALRQHARQLLRQPDDVSAHWGRINAALQLPGSEPVQGALADLFLSFDAEGESLKRSALESVRTRLAAHVVRSFSAQAGGLPLSRITVPVLWINSADDFINPPNLHIAEREVAKMPKATFILIPETADTRGHSTHTWAVFWKNDLVDLLKRSER